jgi:hypothetical protein
MEGAVGAGLAVVFVAASFGAAPAATPPGAAMERSMLVGLVEVVDCGDAALAPFLRDRLAGSGRLAPDGSHPRLVVTVEHGAGRSCAVSVVAAGEVLARRELEAGFDRTAMHLAAWLFVRSTLERARGGMPVSVAVGAGEPASDSAPPVPATETPRPALADVATPVALPPAPDATDTASTGTPATGRLTLTGAAVGFCSAVGPDSLWSVGPCGSLSSRPGVGVSGWAELGYAVSPAAKGVVVHHLAAAFALAADPPWLPALELGVLVQVSPKLGVSDDRERWAVGLDLGPVARFTSGPIVARIGWSWAAMRQRWLTRAGAREEAPWTVTAGAGVGWP